MSKNKKLSYDVGNMITFRCRNTVKMTSNQIRDLVEKGGKVFDGIFDLLDEDQKAKVLSIINLSGLGDVFPKW